MKSLLNFALLSLGEAGISSAYTISNLYLTPPQLVSRKRAVERMVSMAGGMLVSIRWKEQENWSMLTEKYLGQILKVRFGGFFGVI